MAVDKNNVDSKTNSVEVEKFLRSFDDLPDELNERINCFLLKLFERKKSLGQ